MSVVIGGHPPEVAALDAAAVSFEGDDFGVVDEAVAHGGPLGVESFEATTAGNDKLRAWLASFGPINRVGIEGTGSYGAGLARSLRASGVEVVEVDRPNRQARRRTGKSDPADAVEAARAALSGRAQGVGKTRDGNVGFESQGAHRQNPRSETWAFSYAVFKGAAARETKRETRTPSRVRYRHQVDARGPRIRVHLGGELEHVGEQGRSRVEVVGDAAARNDQQVDRIRGAGMAERPNLSLLAEQTGGHAPSNH